MKIDILTLFPEMFFGPFESSMIKKARERELIEINLVNIRDFAPGKHRVTDDTPYGGGGGMLLKPEPISRALECNRGEKNTGKVILMCPQGETFHNGIARQLAQEEHLSIICGHYEGIDERIRSEVDWEISIGDFVVTGGEIPAMLVVDSVCRFIPDFLGEPDAANKDSFAHNLLEYPQYTRPRDHQGSRVPDVLLNGNHSEIDRWRRQESLLRTIVRRPDLLRGADLDEEDKCFLTSLLSTIRNLLPEE